MEKVRKGHKLRNSIIIITTILVVLTSILLIYYFAASYKVFDQSVQTEVAVPGLEDGFVPQGMAYADDNAGYLMTGYMDDEALKSRIYFVPDSKDAPHYVTVEGASLPALEHGHLGGVATVGDNVWLASEGVVMRVSLKDILATKSGENIKVIDEFKAGNQASFAYATDDKLYIGEFYKEGKFDTNATHKIQTTSGFNNAIASEYTIDSNSPNGVKSTSPNLIISLPNQVQGFALSGKGQIILSTSYSIYDSQIYMFGVDLNVATDKTFTVEGKEYPLYILDESVNLDLLVAAPSMSEGIDVIDGRLHVMFESACNKYKMVNRTRTSDILSVSIAKLNENK